MIDAVRWDGWVNFPQDLWGTNIKIRTTPANPSVVGAGMWVISSDTSPYNWIDPKDPTTGVPLLDMANTTGFYNPVQG